MIADASVRGAAAGLAVAGAARAPTRSASAAAASCGAAGLLWNGLAARIPCNDFAAGCAFARHRVLQPLRRLWHPHLGGSGLGQMQRRDGCYSRERSCERISSVACNLAMSAVCSSPVQGSPRHTVSNSQVGERASARNKPGLAHLTATAARCCRDTARALRSARALGDSTLQQPQCMNCTAAHLGPSSSSS